MLRSEGFLLVFTIPGVSSATSVITSAFRVHVHLHCSILLCGIDTSTKWRQPLPDDNLYTQLWMSERRQSTGSRRWLFVVGGGGRHSRYGASFGKWSTLDEENTQWCPLGPFQSANEESLLCSRVFFCSGTHTPKQKEPGEGSNMKNDWLCKRTTPKHASTACTRLPVKNIANTHAHASFHIHFNEALDWMGDINIWKVSHETRDAYDHWTPVFLQNGDTSWGGSSSCLIRDWTNLSNQSHSWLTWLTSAEGRAPQPWPEVWMLIVGLTGLGALTKGQGARK